MGVIIIKKNRHMKIKKIALVLAGVCIATSSTASPLTVTGVSGNGLAAISATNAKIAAAGAMTSAIITKSATETAAAITSSASDINKSIVQSTLKDSMDNARLISMQNNLEMDYKSELANKELMQQRSLREGDTKEDIKYVLEFLQKAASKNLNMSEVVAHAKSSLDGKEITVQPIIDTNNNCIDSNGKSTCGFTKKLEASNIITYYASMCSDNKRKKYQDHLKKKADLKTKSENAVNVKKWVSQTNSKSASAQRIKESLEISCTPELVKSGVCNGGVSNGDKNAFVDKMLRNEIIPAGDVSALNFYSPLSVGGFGYVDMGSPENRALAAKLSNDALEKTGHGKEGVPTIVDTYRNSSQLRAAMDFSKNVINMEAVSNQSPGQRLKPSSVDFQNRFLSRVASLDLAKSALDDSISERRGARLSSIDPYSLPKGSVVKEWDDGASSIDIQKYNVSQALDSVSSDNISKLNEMTSGQMDVEIYKSLVTQNKILLNRLMKAEKGVLLEASLVANEVNSPENVRFINSVVR